MFKVKYTKTKSQGIISLTGSCFYTGKKCTPYIQTNMSPEHCNDLEVLPFAFHAFQQELMSGVHTSESAMVNNPRVLNIVIVNTDCQLEGIYDHSGNMSVRNSPDYVH